MTSYASDTAAILAEARTALDIDAGSTLDIGALDPQVYLDRTLITGGDVRVFVGWVRWYVLKAHANAQATYATQYAVSVYVGNGEIGDAIDEAVTLRGALNGLQYRITDGPVRTLHVTDAYPQASENGDIDIIQFLVDIT